MTSLFQRRIPLSESISLTVIGSPPINRRASRRLRYLPRALCPTEATAFSSHRITATATADPMHPLLLLPLLVCLVALALSVPLPLPQPVYSGDASENDAGEESTRAPNSEAASSQPQPPSDAVERERQWLLRALRRPDWSRVLLLRIIERQRQAAAASTSASRGMPY